MLKLRTVPALACVLISTLLPSSLPAAESSTADFREVFDVISAHLAPAQAGDLNRDALEGLLSHFKGRAWLVRDEPASTNLTAGIATNLFDSAILRITVPKLDKGAADQIAADINGYNGTNKLDGLVLDLRYSGGNDYAEAVKVADLFLEKESALLDWGNGSVSSTTKTNAIKLPLVVLINAETSAAAEALGAVLRIKDRCLLLGNSTAGLAVMTTDYPLKNGQKLRVATAGVKLGNGELLSHDGISPDIRVQVDAAVEKAFYADSFKEEASSKPILPNILGEHSPLNAGGTNATAKPRPLNEAELMRERKERPGVDVDDLPLRSPSAKEGEQEKPVVRDPVLARAIDLAKGIAALQRNTPQ